MKHLNKHSAHKTYLFVLLCSGFSYQTYLNQNHQNQHHLIISLFSCFSSTICDLLVLSALEPARVTPLNFKLGLVQALGSGHRAGMGSWLCNGADLEEMREAIARSYGAKPLCFVVVCSFGGVRACCWQNVKHRGSQRMRTAELPTPAILRAMHILFGQGPDCEALGLENDHEML